MLSYGLALFMRGKFVDIYIRIFVKTRYYTQQGLQVQMFFIETWRANYDFKTQLFFTSFFFVIHAMLLLFLFI